MVELYEDRVEVINPGNSLIEIDRIIDERRSRNEKLAEVMRSLGICEERGGGIDKAILEIEEMRERFSLAQDDYQAVSAVIADAKKAGRIVAAEENQGRRNARYVPYWAR